MMRRDEGAARSRWHGTTAWHGQRGVMAVSSDEQQAVW